MYKRNQYESREAHIMIFLPPTECYVLFDDVTGIVLIRVNYGEKMNAVLSSHFQFVEDPGLEA